MTDFILRFLHYLKTNGDIKDFYSFFNGDVEWVNIIFNDLEEQYCEYRIDAYSDQQAIGFIIESLISFSVKNEKI